MSVYTNEVIDTAVLIGSQFSEPVRVIGNSSFYDGFLIMQLAGTYSQIGEGRFVAFRTGGIER